jgi:hypothetical protein
MGSPGRCANLQTDTLNCGACGVVCPGSQSCVAGTCRALCGPGQTACGPSMTCVDLQSNAANCGACGVLCPPGQSCGNGTCLAPFRVTSFSASCNLVNTEALQGDQRGGLAVSSSYLLVNADQGAARFDPVTVANAPQLVPEQLDGAVYDVFSGQLFLLGDSAGPIRLGTGTRTVDRLWRTNSGTWVTSSPLMLSRSIVIDSNYGANVGVYNGGGRAIVHTTNVYDINLSSGLVTDRGVMAQPPRTFAENFRTTGVAEQIGGTLYLTYVQSAGAISRSRVPDGLVTNVATFGGLGLGDAAHLAVNSAGTSSRWLVRIEGGGQFGSIAEALVSCPLTVTQNTTTGDFSMSGYSTAGCTAIDTNTEVSDDRGPLAVSYGSVYLVGDGGSRRYYSATAPSAMNSAAIGGVMDHVVYNVRNGALYGLFVGDLPLQSYSGSVNVTRLVPLAEFSLQPAGTPLTLSQPIAINTGSTTSNMVFNGWDRVVIGTDTRLWNINLANGEVRDLGAWTAPTHTYNEMWAATGIAESTGSATDLVYVQSTTAIGRMRVGTGAVSVAGSFSNLGDTATIGFSPSRNRWYMQFEYTNQFVATPSAEWVASCAGTFAN